MIVNTSTLQAQSSFCALLFVMAVVLSGCVAAAVNTTTIAVKSAPRGELQPQAEAGDANAQYELGKSYCCMGPGFDTQTATEWFCKSARQGNADAMYELGRVYLGDVSRSPAPGQKLLRAISAKRNSTSAYLWLSRAAANNHTDAVAKLDNLKGSISADELAEAINLDASWPNVPCEYSDVFGS